MIYVLNLTEKLSNLIQLVFILNKGFIGGAGSQFGLDQRGVSRCLQSLLNKSDLRVLYWILILKELLGLESHEFLVDQSQISALKNFSIQFGHFHSNCSLDTFKFLISRSVATVDLLKNLLRIKPDMVLVLF